MTEDDKLKILSYRRKHQRCRYCKYYFIRMCRMS